MNYKSLLIVLSLLLFSLPFSAQKPQKILGIAKEDKSLEYYLEQKELWEKEIKKDPENGNAWRQKYSAQRAFLQKSYPNLWQNDQAQIFSQLNEIIVDAKEYIDGSFEFYFIKSLNSTGKESIKYSKMAYELDPDRNETHGWLFVDVVMNFKHKKAKKIGARLLKNNLYSNANLIWNLNSLNTMEKNSIFIGNGDLDIIPKWALQYGNGVREDILVISRWSMANDESYRDSIFHKIGMNKLEKSIEDFTSPTEYVDYLTLHMLKNRKRKAYMTCGGDMNFFEKSGIADKIYLVGTTYVYSENRFDNNRVLRENLDQYQLDHLIKNFQKHPEDQMINTHMHLSYLPGIMNVLEYYEKNNLAEKALYFEKVFKTIAAQSGKEKEVLGWYTPGS
ncbi:MAG: hypothetical protein P8M34_14845 [Saprospiraceae bacterium]|nr:hypothetical protein [Saprospiraceae bacterium]|tara:strand:- start:1222 stop:2394 length:1173 start_codon:yes stop_codon:yes gene_type:complete